MNPTGATLISIERQRQIEEEGWTPEHDAEHANHELVSAAIAYAVRSVEGGDPCEWESESWWPWGLSSWKPSEDPIRNLVKAGALIAAEIDRRSA